MSMIATLHLSKLYIQLAMVHQSLTLSVRVAAGTFVSFSSTMSNFSELMDE